MFQQQQQQQQQQEQEQEQQEQAQAQAQTQKCDKMMCGKMVKAAPWQEHHTVLCTCAHAQSTWTAPTLNT